MRTDANEPSTAKAEEELRAIKTAAIRATAESNADFYRDYLAEDAIGVTPAGVFSKAQILQAMGDGQAFKSSKIENTHAKSLSPDVGLVTYEATFEWPTGEKKVLFVSTLYERRNGAWKGVFYQQTPLPLVVS